MNICLPVLENNGLLSAVSPHFGQAPAHLVISPEGEIVHYAEKTACGHAGCTPVDILAAHAVKAIVCQGLGRGAFFRLRELGIDVFQTDCETVDEALVAYRRHTLAPMSEDGLCQGHEHSDHDHDGHPHEHGHNHCH
ncbi:NifB/NifX family molybdenum-iron cluster-binding protein [Ruficoccus amylovorans]|uniref:NifB/NifX family molybdenum-iron cluster-binding protein n=1 Tax=Ruficoccus amylovorans TaxID=1804625 RepID=A0A842HDB0_9BACT|nr:NifB/NifX family molybdenum-iron cluster-binding protein [Ruficoccus amylovorans]MBC2594189.1 NifB/NifX family molybdenum-iron cluster-binding protein [Ruficoccus amylovorans]